MSYLELDDFILEHPKFVLAADRGGSSAIHMWLGLRAYCGQHLTDGDVPKYMLRKVSGPERARDREHALAVLIEVGLVEDHTDHYQLHDFLDHCRSREQILAARARNRDRQAKSRVSNGVTARVVTPAVTLPSPLLSAPLRSRSDLTPPPSVGPPLRVERDISSDDLASFGPDPTKFRAKRLVKSQWRRFPLDFEPDETHRKLAAQLGLNLAQQLAEIRDHEFAKPKSDAAATLRTWLRNAPKFGAPTLGASRAHRPDPRNEAQDRNADHDTRERLAAAEKIKKAWAETDAMGGTSNV